MDSLAELETQFDIALRQNLLKNLDYNETMQLLSEVGRMLNGLIASLTAKH